MDYFNDYIFKLVIQDNVCDDNPYPYSIHGLWPDYSNGSYPQYCNNMDGCSHNINTCHFNVSEYINSTIINLMDKIWCSYNHLENPEFWCHEWCKHGTCTDLGISDYFSKTINLFTENIQNKKYDLINCYVEYLDKTFIEVKC